MARASKPKAGSTPWTHASKSAAALKAWQTKRSTGKLHSGGTTPYVPHPRGANQVARAAGTTFQLGAVYDFGPKGRFRKTAAGWQRLSG